MAIILKRNKGAALTHDEADNNFDELDKIYTGKIFPNTKGVGIKISGTTADFGWHDMIGPLFNVPTNLNSATYTTYRGGIRAYMFHEGDEAFCSFHVPHDYLPNSDIFIHVHWSHNSPIVTGGTATWAFETMYAKGHNQGAFDVPVIIPVQQAASLVPYQHMIAETIGSTQGGSGVLLDTSLLETDGIIQVRLHLIANTITDNLGAVVPLFGHFVDIHYKSTGLPTKNKAPDFWT